MSANNYLRIYLIQKGEEKTFVVGEYDADTNHGTKLKEFKHLNSAINYANDYSDKNIVEYGIRIDPKAAKAENW